MAPTLTVVIPALNEALRLPTLLDLLERQTARPDEIIVADARSSDATPQVARSMGARVVTGGLPPVGRNAGAAVAGGELILFLDADTEPPVDFIERALAEFEERELSVATAPIVSVEPRLEYAVACGAANAYTRAIRRVSPHAPGPCILVRREVHERIGGFDEAAILAEDHDYVRRASRIAPFGVFRRVEIPVSMRRVKLEGRLHLARMYLYAEMRTLHGRPVTSAPFAYGFARDGQPDLLEDRLATSRPSRRERVARTLHTLAKPSTERQNDAIGIQLVTALGGGAGAAALAASGAGPGVYGPVAGATITVSGLAAYVALRKFRYERHYGPFLMASSVVASADIVDGQGRVLVRCGIDEVCELHVIGHLLRMSALSRKGAEGRLLILLESMRGLKALLDDIDDGLYEKTALITARSDLVGTLFKMGFAEIPEPPPFDWANRINKFLIMRMLSLLMGRSRVTGLDRYRMAVMPKDDFASAAFRDEVARQIRRVERDIARLGSRDAPAIGSVADPT